MDNEVNIQEQQTLRMSVLYDAALLISGCEDYDAILSGLARHLKAILPVDAAWLLTHDSRSGLSSVARYSSEKPGIEEPVIFRRTLLESVSRQEKSGRFTDAEALNELFENKPPENLSSVIACPLQRGDQPEGYLLLGARADSAYQKDHSILLFLLGLQLATVLRTIRLHRELMDINSRLNLIFDNIEEGILLLDRDFHLQSSNPPVRELFFRQTPPAEGEDFIAFLLEQRTRFQIGRWISPLKKIRERTLAEFPFSFELIEAKDQDPQALFLEFLPVEKGGQRLGFLVILRDIAEMKKADDLRKDLTAMLIHDLRSPLGIINWNMEMILEGVTGDITTKQEKLLKGTIDNSRELLNMIDSLLDIDRLETGSLTLELQMISMRELITSLIEHMEILSSQMQLGFSLDISEDLPPLTADPSLIRRVLFNLLFNASKYSPPGSTISIRVSYDSNKDTITTSVSDQGPGIPKKYRNLIFDKYVQVQAKSRGEVKSKGLGLTFCKLAVEAHNGSIWVESEEGEGATFRFTLSREYSEARL